MTLYQGTRIVWPKEHEVTNSVDFRALVQGILNNGGNICGGFPLAVAGKNHRPAHLHFDAGDIDVWPKNEQSRRLLLEYLKNEGYEMDAMTIWASTFNKLSLDLFSYPIQIININCENPADIVNEFDLAVCQFFIKDINTVVGTQQAVSDVSTRQITILKGWDTPIDLAYRLAKYVQKGYYINPLEIIKIGTLLEGELGVEVNSLKLRNGYDLQHLLKPGRGDNNLFKEVQAQVYNSFFERWKKRFEQLKRKYEGLNGDY